eukprot:1346471-Rhodomonas_salina.1
MLELSFNPFKASTANSARDKLNALLATDLDLRDNGVSITKHISDIAIARNELVSDEPADRVDKLMIGSLVKKLMEASGNANTVAVQLWRAVAI